MLVALLPLALGAVLGVGGCDAAGSDHRPLDVGQRLAVTEYAPTQPTSRSAYAEMGVIGGYGSVWLYTLGTGPSDPPRLVRSIRLPGLITTTAQVDAHGYIWVATPDQETAGPYDAMHIVDPYEARVHRTIELPDDLYSVADLSVYDDAVYVRAWRDGFSGGIGRVDPACATDEDRCAVEPFAELGNVGSTYQPSLRRVGGSLYSSSTANSRDERPSTDSIDPATGEITKSVSFSGKTETDGRSLFLTTRDYTGTQTLVQLALGSLDVLGAVETPGVALVAVQDGRVYLSYYESTSVRVYDAETLEPLQTYDVRTAGGVYDTFGFVAPDVLMLNGTAALDTSTGHVLLDPSHGQANLGSGPGDLRLPQGHLLGF